MLASYISLVSSVRSLQCSSGTPQTRPHWEGGHMQCEHKIPFLRQNGEKEAMREMIICAALQIVAPRIVCMCVCASRHIKRINQSISFIHAIDVVFPFLLSQKHDSSHKNACKFFLYKVSVTVEHSLLTWYIQSYTHRVRHHGIVTLATPAALLVCSTRFFRFLHNMVHK